MASRAGAIDVTDEQVRNARHAYYANTSYFDSKVGELVATVEEAGLIDDTVIIVTADHGDMLGERGLWYKMNFFEHSARVPLIMAGPDVDHGQSSNACSLVDILPTFIDIAGAGGATKPVIGQPIDGRSLWPLATGGSDDVDEAIGEYCAEMTAHPVFMIRRGKYKYIHCDGDPPMLFDLEADPDELINLVTDPDHARASEEFAAEVAARWDSPQIRKDVIRTQKQRRAVHAAMEAGPVTSWDYSPPRDFSREYVRNHMDWPEVAARTRFPPLEG